VDAKVTAARDVWLRCDRWPDAKDLGAWAKDIFRIEGARSGQEKAIALWKWLHVCLARSAPAPKEGDPGRESYLLDTLKYLTVYGGHYCDGLARVMVNAWEAAGAGPARKVVVFGLGHTVAELRYRDDDGKTRWHVFDPEHCWYVFSRDGGHIASLAEIDADPDLLLRPVDPPRPYFFAAGSRDRWGDREFATRNPVEADAPAPVHRMRVDLRRGECWRRLWQPGPEYWPCAPGTDPAPLCATWGERDILGGAVADTFLGEYVGPYVYRRPATGKAGGSRVRQGRCRRPGCVELTYDVPLAGGAFREGAWKVRDVASPARASGGSAAVHPARLNRVGVLVYEVRTPYIITDARLEATARTGSNGGDMFSIHVSIDGGSSWHCVWGTVFSRKGRLSARPKRIRATFGARAYREGEFSVVGKYGYLVRFDLLARKDLNHVGLDALTLRTWCLCNMMALPALLPGRNQVTVSTASAPPGARLRVGYEWTEKPRGQRRIARVLPGTGGAFTIRAGGRKPSDIRMREVSVELF